MSVLDQALNAQAAAESPLALAARMRQEARDRRIRENTLQSQNLERAISASSKLRDMQDRQNLTPLYKQWAEAPTGPEGEGQRQEALQGIGAIDPEKAQAMQKNLLDITQKYDAMSKARQEKVRETALNTLAKAEALRNDPEAWKQEFPDVPIEQADQMIRKNKAMLDVFTRYDRIKAEREQTPSAKESYAKYVARTRGISEKDALDWIEATDDGDLRARILNTLRTSNQFDESQIPAELEKSYELVKRVKGQATPDGDPLGLGQ